MRRPDGPHISILAVRGLLVAAFTLPILGIFAEYLDHYNIGQNLYYAGAGAMGSAIAVMIWLGVRRY